MKVKNTILAFLTCLCANSIFCSKNPAATASLHAVVKPQTARQDSKAHAQDDQQKFIAEAHAYLEPYNQYLFPVQKHQLATTIKALNKGHSIAPYAQRMASFKYQAELIMYPPVYDYEMYAQHMAISSVRRRKKKDKSKQTSKTTAINLTAVLKTDWQAHQTDLNGAHKSAAELKPAQTPLDRAILTDDVTEVTRLLDRARKEEITSNLKADDFNGLSERMKKLILEKADEWQKDIDSWNRIAAAAEAHPTVFRSTNAK